MEYHDTPEDTACRFQCTDDRCGRGTHMTDGKSGKFQGKDRGKDNDPDNIDQGKNVEGAFEFQSEFQADQICDNTKT